MSGLEWFYLALLGGLSILATVWLAEQGLEYQILALPLFPLAGWLVGRHAPR